MVCDILGRRLVPDEGSWLVPDEGGWLVPDEGSRLVPDEGSWLSVLGAGRDWLETEL